MDRRGFLIAAALAAAAPRRALAQASRARPLVLVTADLESRVLAVDPGNALVLEAIATPAYPRSIEAVGAVAVVAHSELGAVTLIDAGSLRVVHVLEGLGEPRYTAAHPDGRHAYVTDAARGELVALDLHGARVAGGVEVGALARHLTIDPRGRRIWVALGSKADEIAVVDVHRPARPLLAARFRPPFRAHDVACAPDGRHLWISSGDRSQLAVYDVRSGRLLATPSGDWPPQHITFAGSTAYVTSGWSGTLRAHRASGRPLLQVTVPVGSYNVQHGLGRVVTPSLGRGALTILDERGRTLHRERVARSSHDACLVVSR
jgi:DNA-binding beta-propeller fold protein YncE